MGSKLHSCPCKSPSYGPAQDVSHWGRRGCETRRTFSQICPGSFCSTLRRTLWVVYLEEWIKCAFHNDATLCTKQGLVCVCCVLTVSVNGHGAVREQTPLMELHQPAHCRLTQTHDLNSWAIPGTVKHKHTLSIKHWRVTTEGSVYLRVVLTDVHSNQSGLFFPQLCTLTFPYMN